MRKKAHDELHTLAPPLGRLDVRPLDDATAVASVVLAASYGLKAADAVHLATAVVAGADRSVTNNRRHFPQAITEIDVVYPSDLDDPSDA